MPKADAMPQEKTALQKRIESGNPVIIAEIAPPKSLDAASIRAMAKWFAGKVHALGVSDNRDSIRMSAMAAASIVLAEKIEPILHMVTRDRNRIALLSDCIGAQAIGIHNILCTSGTHQSLLPVDDAKNVFDFDATLLLQNCRNLQNDVSFVDEKAANGQARLCMGAVASPFADPMELQIARIAQKINAGAQFLVTPPLFDLDRFSKWWKEVTARGLHQKAAFIAGIKVLTDVSSAREYAAKRPVPMVPDSVISRLASKEDPSACRTEGIAIAAETIQKLSDQKGIRGFEIVCDEELDASLELLDSLKSQLE
jgi:methylenetetrahydrofolate reductase (NADPH)